MKTYIIKIFCYPWAISKNSRLTAIILFFSLSSIIASALVYLFIINNYLNHTVVILSISTAAFITGMYPIIADYLIGKIKITNYREKIIINGHVLNTAQYMTVRCALESFSSDLSRNGLGEDDTGKKITTGYLFAIREIRKYLYE